MKVERVVLNEVSMGSARLLARWLWRRREGAPTPRLLGSSAFFSTR